LEDAVAGIELALAAEFEFAPAAALAGAGPGRAGLHVEGVIFRFEALEGCCQRGMSWCYYFRPCCRHCYRYVASSSIAASSILLPHLVLGLPPCCPAPGPAADHRTSIVISSLILTAATLWLLGVLELELFLASMESNVPLVITELVLPLPPEAAAAAMENCKSSLRSRFRFRSTQSYY